MLTSLFQDCRAGWRSLSRQPLFTLAAMGSLALGIGACTVVFSVVYTLVLKPLPYAAPEQLVQILSDNPAQRGLRMEGVAPGALQDLLAARMPAFDALAGMAYDYSNLTNVPVPEQLTVSLVTGDYFRLYGVPAALGRTLGPSDCRLDSPPVVVLGDKLWRSQFHADQDLVGKTITLGGKPCTVIGVMPPSFKEPQNVAEAWLPQPLDEIAKQPRTSRYLNVVGRLSGEGSGAFAAGRAALAVAAANQARAYPAENTGWSFVLESLREELLWGQGRALGLLFGAVVCVLLVACVNVANLQLVRATGRMRELGVRMALGASRTRLMSQWLIESLLLAGGGGVLGVLLAAWGVDAIAAVLPAGYSPRQEEIALSLPVLLFALGTTFATGLLSGIIPAWFAARRAPAAVLGGASGRGASEGNSGMRTRGFLVTAEIGLALVLLAGAGLLGRSFYSLLQVSPGLRTERVLTMGLSLSDSRYPEAPDRAQFYHRCLETIDSVPGVEKAVFASTPPFNWTLETAFIKPGQATGDAASLGQKATYDSVSPGFFSALDVPVRRGRGFQNTDDAHAPTVLVVNEAFVRRFFPGTEPVGQRIELTGFRSGNIPAEIIGVTANVRRQGLEKEPPTQIYSCYLQRPTAFGTLFVRARGGIGAESLTKAVQSAVSLVDSDQPLTNISTLEKAVRNSVGPTRLYLALFLLFAALTLALAALGIYGTVSYSVVQRTREIGIRLALGAQRAQVLQLILGQATRLILFGVCLGVLVSLALARLLESLLFGVSSTDPLTLAAVALLLGAVALLASYLPARRATRIDPLTALREQ